MGDAGHRRGDVGRGHGVDVWDTQAHFDSFAQDQLGPAAEKGGMALPQTKSYEVQNFLN